MVLGSAALILIHDLKTLFVVLPFVGLSTALFWTPLQAWLKDAGEEQALTRSTSLFNVSWSVGALIGTASTGFLVDWNTRLPFGVTALLGLSILALLLRYRTPRPEGRQEERDETSPSIQAQQARKPRHRMMGAWIAVFFVFFAFGHVMVLFPKLATEMGYTGGDIGLFMTAAGLTRTLAFGSFGQAQRRYGSHRLLIWSKLATVAALLAFFGTPTTPGFVVAFLLLGVGVAMSFSVSQYRSLREPSLAGRRIGINESVIVTGLMIGAAFSGLLAEAHGLYAPYLVTAILGGTLFLLQPWWLPRLVREGN